ncbi:cysteine desufuration protein SufE [Deinococcus sp. RL]|uniref:SufE family protein n=1 Tax=Deinococcus sp. RL TaxID=1489678 RepID=UPI0004D527A6|nr:SufE family protein [Deinococcus sp. RL]KEF33918.1 cysteine desufuration protein SufE [Deinococcus sp. RL]
MTDAAPLPEKLQQIVNLFRTAPKPLRLQALLEYSKKLPPLPEKYALHPEFLKPVPECASPFFLVTERDERGGVNLYFKVPEEAPTVRGYAGILHEALSGEAPETILSVPDQFYMDMGLTELITPMRLRGMGAILMRLKNEVRESA